MKVGQRVGFEFIAEKFEGEIVELYTCTNRQMALVEADCDGLKYPIEVSKLTELDTDDSVEEVEVVVGLDNAEVATIDPTIVEESFKEPIKIFKEEKKKEAPLIKPKKVTKKSRVLALYEECREQRNFEQTDVHIPFDQMIERGFGLNDIYYFKAVLKEINLRVEKQEYRLRVY